jgi:hypothetical protein
MVIKQEKKRHPDEVADTDVPVAPFEKTFEHNI